MLAILLIAFLVAILIGFDVGFSMILAAWLGILFKSDQAVDAAMMPLSMIAGVDSSALVQVPLFILAGELMNLGGLTGRLIDWAQALVGRLRGSLGHVSILTNLVMAGVSGSAVADAVATGKPLVPAMVKAGYGGGFAGAVIVAGALLGPIIPPSIPMVVYAQLSMQSVVKLFMAGIVPGLMLAAGFLVLCTVIAHIRGFPTNPPPDPAAALDEMRQRGNALARAFSAWASRLPPIVGVRWLIQMLISTGRASWALLMPVIIIGGIRFGYVTDTEAAAVAAVYALLVSVLIYRAIKLRELPKIFFQAGRSTAVILFLLAAAGPFSWLVAESQVNITLLNTIRGWSRDPVTVLLIINGLLLVVGCILEPLPAMIIFLPMLIPLGQELGIDPIQFGAVVVLNLMIGLMHPPIGLLLFVVASVGRVQVTPIMWHVLPFLAWAIIVLILTIVFPPLTTWLPQHLH